MPAGSLLPTCQPQAGGSPAQPKLALAAGVAGVIVSSISAFGEASASASCSSQLFCLEYVAVGTAFLLSCWCVAAAANQVCGQSGVLPPRRRRALAATLLLARALLCGLSVALLGWSAAAHGDLSVSDLVLMATMQANASIGAWGACKMQRDARAKSPTPHDDDDDDDDVACSSPPASCRRKNKRGSVTLPRGWRFHAREGLFEHKRSGRLQREPPSTGETGSPLHADLPCCDEEGGLLLEKEVFDSCSGSDSGSESRHTRSRTWTHRTCPIFAEPSTVSSSSRTRGASTPMSVWELREAMAMAADAPAAEPPLPPPPRGKDASGWPNVGGR